MQDYSKLVEDLRNGVGYWYMNNSLRLVSILGDAADAIEALQAKLPKLGEWVEGNRRPRSSQFVCSECHRTAYDPQPTRDKAWEKRCRYAYCPNCGAMMNDSNAYNALDNAQDGPIITPCRGCSDYDGYGGCKSKGGCARAKMEVQK